MRYPPSAHDNKLLDLCRAGLFAEAIKLHKETTGEGLKQSKEYIDELATRYFIDIPKVREGCFVATACYGDHDAPEVKILRNFRDHTLKKFLTGKIFIGLYYFISPLLVRCFLRSDRIKMLVRILFLERIVRIIKCKDNFK